MAGSARCPKCRQGVLLKEADDEGRIKCWTCGSRLQVDENHFLQEIPSDEDAAEEIVAEAVEAGELVEADAEPSDVYRIAGRSDAAENDDSWTASSYDEEPLSEDDEELAELAPVRPPKKPKSQTKSGRKKSRKPAPPPSPLESLKNPKVAGIVAGLATLVVSLLAFLFRPAANPNNPNAPLPNPAQDVAGQDGKPPAQAASKILDRPSVLLKFDQPIAGHQPAGAVKTVEPLFKPAPAYDEAKSLTRADVEPAVVQPPAEAVAASADPPAAPLWQTEPDPAPPELRYTLASGLKYELLGPGTHPGIRPVDSREEDAFPNLLQTIGLNLPPIMAEQNGPYMILAPVWKQCPYGRHFVKPKNKQKNPNGHYEVVEIPQDPIPVIDLRTGQAAGVFDWHIPFFCNPALSPDGKYLVGPHHVPFFADEYKPPTEDELAVRKSLYVWERDSKKPPKKIPMPGLVACVRFAGPTTAAILVEQPQRQLELWDVVAGKRLGLVEVPIGPKTPSKNVFPYMYTDTDRTDLHVNYPRASHMLATSPGGRYAAVATEKGVTFVSVADAKILGTLELKDTQGAYESYLGMTFLPAGDELCIAHRAYVTNGGAETRLVCCRVQDGTIRLQKLFNNTVEGPLWVHPDRQSFLLVDYPKGNRGAVPACTPHLFDLDKTASEQYLAKWRDPIHRTSLVISMPDEGPVMLLRQPGYKNTADITEPTLVTVERDVYRAEIEKKTRLNEHGLPKRPRVAEVDRSTMPQLANQPPGKWTELPPIVPHEPLPITTLGRVPWPDAWSDRTAMLVSETRQSEPDSGVYFLQVDGRSLDLKPEAELSQPIRLLPWAFNPNKSGYTREATGGLVLGLHRDGEQIVFADPENPHRVDVMTAAGVHQLGFFAQPDRTKPILWTDFDAANRVLTVSHGELSAWDVTEKTVKGSYTLNGGYTTPAVFTADRSVLALSRGGSFDLIETATGKLLNRCAVGVPGAVYEIAFSPNGRQVAALFAEASEPPQSPIRRGILPAQKRGAVSSLVVWDMNSGEAQIAEAPLSGFGRLAWLDPEHICLCSSQTLIYDTKLGLASVTYTYSGYSPLPDTGLSLNVSPDGRIWHVVPEPRDSMANFSHSWKAAEFHETMSDELKPYFAADRSVFDIDTTPIRLEIDLGDEQQGKAHALAILASLQQRGYRIGPGGALLRVTAKVAGTGEYIEFERATIEVPRVNYFLSLLDAQGREIWSGASSGSFLGERSKYVTKPDYETRVKSGGATFFDFKGKDPHKAIVDEIIESGRQLEIPSTLPQKQLFGAGQYVAITKKLHWDPPANP